jgi:FSR family fosmidomycin resistance protein-like MFS transporter
MPSCNGPKGTNILPYLLLFLLSLGHGIVDLCGSSLPMLLPVLKSQYHLTYTALGQIVFIFNLSSSLIQPIFGVASDRRSCRWLMPLGCILAVAIAFIGFAPNYGWILICVLLCGIGVAAYHPEGAKQSFMISGEHPAAAQSIYTIGGNLGAGLGPIIATLLLAMNGMKGIIWLIIPNMLVAVLIMYRLPVLSQLGREKEIQCRQIERKSVGAATWGMVIVLVLICTVRSIIYTCVTTFIPLYAINDLKESHFLAGLCLSGFLLTGVLGSAIAGPLADRWGRSKILFVSFLIAIPPLLLLPYTKGVLSLIMACWSGFSIIASFGITVVIAQELIPGQVGLASGLILGLASGIAALGVLVFGAIADARGVGFVLKLVSILPVIPLALTSALPEQ